MNVEASYAWHFLLTEFHMVPTSDVNFLLFKLSSFDNVRKVKNKSKSILGPLTCFLQVSAL